jgi:hypothetical protein
MYVIVENCRCMVFLLYDGWSTADGTDTDLNRSPAIYDHMIEQTSRENTPSNYLTAAGKHESAMGRTTFAKVTVASIY